MQDQQHYCPPERRKYVLIASILASAMGFIDFSIIAVALPQIRSVLGASFTEAETLGPALLAYTMLAKHFDLPHIFVCDTNLRDGLLDLTSVPGSAVNRSSISPPRVRNPLNAYRRSGCFTCRLNGGQRRDVNDRGIRADHHGLAKFSGAVGHCGDP